MDDPKAKIVIINVKILKYCQKGRLVACIIGIPLRTLEVQSLMILSFDLSKNLQYENGRTEMTELSEIVDKKSSTSSPPSNVVKRSDSDYTFQSYDCSSRSSTLSSSINGKPPQAGQVMQVNSFFLL